jgi:hypothetical protein
VGLEATTAVLRPRNPWEAIDLGFALVQAWWKPLYKSWFALLLPLTVVLHGVCSQALWLVPWLIWWLKPLLDRIPLYILSHALFGEVPSLRQTLKDLPSLLRPQAIGVLTYARLDPARSFHLPVRQLEKLSRKQRRQRQKILGAKDRGAAIWLTIVCINLEIVVNLAIMGMLWMLVADFADVEFLDLFTSTSLAQQLLFNGLFLCGLCLVEPFYVAAGFTLYLNRRVWLEGWDIEIGFRRLGQRLAHHTISFIAAVTFGCCLGFSALQPALAMPDSPVSEVSSGCQVLREQQARLEKSPSNIKRTLAKVLQEEPFPHCILRERWSLKTKSEELQPSESQTATTGLLGQVFANVIELSLWGAIVLFIGMVAWYLFKNTPPYASQKTTTLASLPPVLQGLDKPITALSTTTAEDAWMLWTTGHQREALSLIYQNTLLALTNRKGVQFGEAATEDECLQIASTCLSWDHEWVRYLKHLTRFWSATAYGHHLPTDEEVRQLCEQWSKYFQVTS